MEKRKEWISDKNFFWVVVGISLVIPAVVVALKLIPNEYRPNAEFAKHLPFVNAIINSLVSVFLILGLVAIRKYKNKGLHQFFMLSAFALSVLFIISYVIKGTVLQEQKFTGEGAIRVIYLIILFSHIILAALILPLILYTIYWSTSGQYARHRKIAKITWPLWLYVGITGPLVYYMLYVM